MVDVAAFFFFSNNMFKSLFLKITIFINPVVMLPKLHSTACTKNDFQHNFPIYEKKIEAAELPPDLRVVH